MVIVFLIIITITSQVFAIQASCQAVSAATCLAQGQPKNKASLRPKDPFRKLTTRSSATAVQAGCCTAVKLTADNDAPLAKQGSQK